MQKEIRRLTKLLLFLGFGGCLLPGYSQECLHSDLSAQYDFVTSIRRSSRDSSSRDSCVVGIRIINKLGITAQNIYFVADFFSIHQSAFSDCNTVRSYVTGKNKDVEAVDNDYGDLIVADFNFDGRDDFAVRRDEGGNGGPLYHFYVQDGAGRFERNVLLSEQMEYFPQEFNPRKKTITTYVHAGVCDEAESIYLFSKVKDKWRLKRRKFIHLCKN